MKRLSDISQNMDKNITTKDWQIAFIMSSFQDGLKSSQVWAKMTWSEINTYFLWINTFDLGPSSHWPVIQGFQWLYATKLTSQVSTSIRNESTLVFFKEKLGPAPQMKILPWAITWHLDCRALGESWYILCMVSWRLWNFQASHQVRIQIRVWVSTYFTSQNVCFLPKRYPQFDKFSWSF